MYKSTCDRYVRDLLALSDPGSTSPALQRSRIRRHSPLLKSLCTACLPAQQTTWPLTVSQPARLPGPSCFPPAAPNIYQLWAATCAEEPDTNTGGAMQSRPAASLNMWCLPEQVSPRDLRSIDAAACTLQPVGAPEHGGSDMHAAGLEPADLM